MSGFWDNLFGRGAQSPPQDAGPPAPEAAAPADPHEPSSRGWGDQDPVPELRAALLGIVRRVNRAGGTMPEGGVPAVREIEDVLRPLLTYIDANPATEAELIPIRSTITDYLPTTVDTYLGLPSDFAQTHRNRQGRTPAEELIEQLHLLGDAVQEYATAIYAGDAQELSNQGRFLSTKFARSDLDL